MLVCPYSFILRGSKAVIRSLLPELCALIVLVIYLLYEVDGE